MKRITIFVIIMLLASSTVLRAVDPEEIINKTLQVKGNDKLKQLKSMKFTGKINSMGQDIPIAIYYKKPNSIRSEMTVQGKKMIQAFDGKDGWYVNPQEKPDPQKMPKEMLEELSNQKNVLESPFSDYKSKGIKIKYIEKKKVDGKNAYKLKLTFKDGSNIFVFIDADKYLFFKTQVDVKQKDKKIKVESYMKNHKAVGGIMIPYLVENFVNGKKVSSMTVDKFEPDAKIDDALFKMPKK